MKRTCVIFLSAMLAVAFVIPQNLEAAYMWSPESGKFVNPEKQVSGNADELFAAAMGLSENKKYPDAIEEFKRLVKKYPSARVAPEAQFKMAELLEETGKFHKAFQAYQKIIANYPQSPLIDQVIERQFRIGNLFLSGKKEKLMGFPVVPALPKAIEVFEQVVANAPFGKYGDQAMFSLGTAYQKSGSLNKALQTYEKLIEDYPDSYLLADAKFQMGEISYKMTRNQSRTVEGIDRAESQFNKFLEEYPDTNVSEKARKLKQAIDEANAEKNFKIAQYYESENRLDSALIYYEDVAAHYAQTSWGEKSKEKIAFFQAPEKFIKAKEQAYETELNRVGARIKELRVRDAGLGKDAEAEKKAISDHIRQLEKKEKRLQANLKGFQKRKVSDIRKRSEALKMKRQELKEKRKSLEQRKKQMKGNPSEDLARFFQSWEESMRAEELALEKERLEVDRIQQEFGIAPRFHLPFRREEHFEKIRQFNIPGFVKLGEELKALGVKKEDLQEVRLGIFEQLAALKAEDVEVLAQKDEFKEALERSEGDLKDKQRKISDAKAELEALNRDLEEKQSKLDVLIKEAEKKDSEFKARMAEAVPEKTKGPARRSRFGYLGFTKDPRKKLARAQRERERISVLMKDKQGMIRALERAFAAELEQAEKTPRADLSDDRELGTLPEVVRLKKKMRLTEREIRWRYDEIQDRNRKRRAMVDELDVLMQTAQDRQWGGAGRTRRIAAAPAVGTYKFFKAFLLGVKQKEEIVSDKAKQMTESGQGEDIDRIREMKENLEIETLLIEARAREVEELQNEFKALKDESLKYDHFTYRSIFAELPGVSLDHIVETAQGVFSRKKEREKEAIEKNLKKEKETLERLGEMKSRADAEIEALTQQLKAEGQEPLPAEKPVVKESPEEPEPDTEIRALQREIAGLQESIAAKEEPFGKERKKYRKELKEFFEHHPDQRLRERFILSEKSIEEKSGVFGKELDKTVKDLRKVIREEQKVVAEQEKLLAARKKKLEQYKAHLAKKKDYREEILVNDLEELAQDIQDTAAEKTRLAEEYRELKKTSGWKPPAVAGK